MNLSKVKKNTVLGVLFFLPVTFLLFLYPAKHNYKPLDIINESVYKEFKYQNNKDSNVQFNDRITVLGFIGKEPLSQLISVSNLKELVYDKFKGFKKFQIVLVASPGTSKDANTLRKEVSSFEELKYFHIVYASDFELKRLFRSLKFQSPLSDNLSTPEVVILDKEFLQRGRLDDKEPKESLNAEVVNPLNSYNSIEVSEIKNKMSEDMRILFTEYRQKRKGNFDSTTRRSQDLKDNE